ncbi:hypothetical protein MN608_00190 [Microdochium nivale]|nr:hypothetical protein MN608_00190 [Microdochium nivale]
MISESASFVPLFSSSIPKSTAFSSSRDQKHMILLLHFILIFSQPCFLHPSLPLLFTSVIVTVFSTSTKKRLSDPIVLGYPKASQLLLSNLAGVLVYSFLMAKHPYFSIYSPSSWTV